MALQADGRRAVLGTNAIQTAFFNLRCDSAKAVSRTPVIRSLVESEAKTSFARPLNIGRHFLVSQLFMAGTSTWLVQVLTGHSRKHAEPFNDGMSVPPQWALRQLRDAIERVLLSLDLAPVAGETSPTVTRRLAVPFGALPAPASDDYINPRLTNPQRVLPPPFDEFTTVALRVIEEARAVMAETPTFANTGQGFVASQSLFDLMDPVDQQTVFSKLAESIMQLGNTAWMVWKREASNQEICMRLSDRSVIALVGIDRTSPGSWREHAEGVGRWARSLFPELAWPTDDFEAHRLLAALALRYRRYRCSPSLLTAGSTVVHAATFSRGSLLRIDEPEAAQVIESRLGKVTRKGQPKGIPAKGEGPIYDLAEELRKVSKKHYPIGGEIQRSVDWEAAVARLDLRGDKRAAALKDVMAEEARLLGKQVDEADKTSTLAGYLGEVLPALELLPRWSDLRTMPGVAIARWVEAAKDELDKLKKDTLAVKNKRTRWFGLKRFLVTGKHLGWAIPRGLFASDGERVFFDGLRKAAASAALLERDHAPIRRLLADHFENWPVLASRAVLASHMLEQAPLRSTEQVVTRVACTIGSCGTLLIEPDVFSHLKSEHAYRPIQIDATLLQRLQDAANDLASPNDEFLFISEDGADWSASMEIDEALVSAAAQVTGDAHVRKHSFRAAAICRRMWPNWEVTARTLISGTSSPSNCRAVLETEYARGFTTVVLAARTAGHGLAIVTLAYYSPPWTFMLSAQFAATLADLPPSSDLAKRVFLGGKSHSADQLLNEPAGHASDTWTALARHCLDRLKLPRLLAVDPPAVVAPRPHEAPLDNPSVSQSIRFLSNALLGENDTKAAHNNGIAAPYSWRLLSQVPLQDRGVLVKRRRGVPTAEALDEDRDFLKSKEAEPLIASLLRSPLPDLRNLCNDLAMDRPNARGRPLGADELLARLKAHLKCLPAVASLHVRFGPKRSPYLTDERLKALGERLLVGKRNERIGAQPQIQLIDNAHPKSSEYAGRWTVVTRVLITAIQAYVNVSKEV